MNRILLALFAITCLTGCTTLVPLQEKHLISTAFVPFCDTSGNTVDVMQPGTRFVGYRSGTNVLIRVGDTLYMANGQFIIPNDGGMNPNEWVVTYRFNPQPERMQEFIDRISVEGILLNSNNVKQLITFIATVAAMNPEQVPAWGKTIASLPEQNRCLLLEALWQADTPLAQSTLKELLANNHSDNQRLSFDPESQPNLLLSSNFSLATLDCLWSAFFATGDIKYLVRLMQALPMILSTNVREEYMVGTAAKWSLTANASAFPDVLTICKEELAKQRPEISHQLESVVADAENNSSQK